jgi:2-iminobutanoate/2-iminopropanoate deaminase
MSRIKRAISPAVTEPQPETWSNCLVVDGVAYVAGMTATGPDGNVIDGEYEQAKVTFGKIKAVIEAASGTMADVVKVIIYVTDITRREEVWQARREFFTGNFPVSTLVQVAALARPAIKVEIEAIAHIGASKG